VEGQLERREDGRWQLRFVRRLPHPPLKVWRALTEPEHLDAWFPFRMEGDRAAGAPLRFVPPDGRGPAIDGRMITFEPPSVLEFRWGGDEVLRFDVQPEGDGTSLTFMNIIDEVGKAARDGAGWHACLDVLACHLSGEEAPWTPTERWHHVHESYVARFGPEASAIGPPAQTTERT